MGALDFLKAEPADALVKPVSTAELGKRSLVEIVNGETRQVLAQLHKGETVDIGAGLPGHGGIDLAHFYGAERLTTVSHLHGRFAFMNDGNVVYSDLGSMNGSVVERRSQSLLSMGNPVPVLYFQMLHNVTAAYLVRNIFSKAAEPKNLPEHIFPPNDVRLKNNDTLYLGFVNEFRVPRGLGRLVAGGAHALQPPPAVVHNGQITVPKLAVYIHS